MNKLNYFMLMLCLNIISIAYSYPFKFTNDSNLDVVFIDPKESHQTRYYIKAGASLETPKDDMPKNYIWVYVQDKTGSNKFTIKYGIHVDKCKYPKESARLPHITYNDLEELESALVKHESAKEPSDWFCYLDVRRFKELAIYRPLTVKDIPRTIIVSDGSQYRQS